MNSITRVSLGFDRQRQQRPRFRPRVIAYVADREARPLSQILNQDVGHALAFGRVAPERQELPVSAEAKRDDLCDGCLLASGEIPQTKRVANWLLFSLEA